MPDLFCIIGNGVTFNLINLLILIVMSMRKWIAESRALSPGLTALSLTMLGMIPVLSLALWLDHRMVTGVAVWVKPMKFTLSALAYSVFFLVMMPLMQPLSKRIRQMAEVMSWMLWLEIILIYAQAARGKASHFNMETMLDGLIFNAMAVGITTFVVLNIVIMVQFMRQKTGNPVMLTGIRWAFLIGITGMLVGYLMTQPTSTQVVELSKGLVPDRLGGHTVGAADGGAGLPFLNWSARFGDLRRAGCDRRWRDWRAGHRATNWPRRWRRWRAAPAPDRA